MMPAFNRLGTDRRDHKNDFNFNNNIESRRDFTMFLYLNQRGTVVTICTTTFKIQQFYFLPTEFIHVFRIDLRTNSDSFSVQH